MKTTRDKLHPSYRHVYDKPKTPLERRKTTGQCGPARIAELERLRDKTNVIQLVARIRSLVRAITDNSSQ